MSDTNLYRKCPACSKKTTFEIVDRTESTRISDKDGSEIVDKTIHVKCGNCKHNMGLGDNG